MTPFALEPPSKLAKLREVVQYNQNLQGRGAGRGTPTGEKGKGRSTILIDLVITGGQIGTPSTAHIEVGTPLESTLDLDHIPAEADEEEVEYLRVQDYESTRILCLNGQSIP